MLAIIAGKGNLPLYIAKNYHDKNNLLILGIEGQCDSISYNDYNYVSVKIGYIKEAINHLKGVKQITFAGKVQRPKFSDIKVDSLGAKLLAKILKNKLLGDDAVMRTISNFFEDYGFEIISPQLLLKGSNTTSKTGAITKIKPNNINDIKLGFKASKLVGSLDIGQSVIVSNGYVVGVEAAEGTDELIRRCSTLLQEDGILVKTMKPVQDSKLDIPTIGLDTIQLLSENKISGIAIEANKVIIVDYDKTIARANDLGIFIYGYS